MDSPISGRRVLVVEDEVLVSWVAQDMLADLGCVVVGPASSVEQALATIASTALDAAVVDINLNGHLSYPVADALIARGVPFVFVTGYDRGGIPEAYRVHPVLQKPLARGVLAEAIGAIPLGPHLGPGVA